jgi:hypothetical protein
VIALALQTRLLALSAVTALVGQRVWTFSLPQDPTLPAVCIQQVSEVEELHLRGTSKWKRARVQIDAVAGETSGGDPYDTAIDVDAAVYGGFSAGAATGLAGFSGTVGGVEIGVIRPVDRREDYSPDELRQVRISRDWFVDFRV